MPSNLEIDLEELKNIMNISDEHRIDRELDHLVSLGLLDGGFSPNSSTTANTTPSPLALQLYVRGQGYVGSPIDYFGITENEQPS